ncbi:hypothetical protein PMAYCL1PPCAC_28174, partial [Pristionchus mayeri]
LVDHPIADVQLAHHLVLFNLIRRITSRAPDGRGEQLSGLVEKRPSDWMHVVVEFAVEAAVDAVVEEVHVASSSCVVGVLGDLIGGHSTVCHDTRHQREGT